MSATVCVKVEGPTTASRCVYGSALITHTTRSTVLGSFSFLYELLACSPRWMDAF